MTYQARIDSKDMEHVAVKYGGSVPRYTSYPTAPHFNDSIDASEYAKWLAKIEQGQSVSLYLHVPFCQEMCWYCGCFTKIVRSHKPVSGYIETLLAEIALVERHTSGTPTANFIHWGGGSPTILTPSEWERVMDEIGQRFVVPSDAEIAVEMDPRTTTKEYVSALARVGVNRVSIGIQEFDEDIQRAINRIQPYETTARVVEWLRDAGIQNLNVDLMYGLPGQSIEHVERMTKKALTLRPQRIALFGYAHVPWMRAHQRLIDDAALPGSRERWYAASIAAEILVSAGYKRIGFDHFALPEDPLSLNKVDQIQRNFQGYTTDDSDTLIGLGASSISSFTQGYAQNISSLRSYTEAVTAGTLPIQRGRALTRDDRLRRDVIERIMCDMSADIGELCAAHGFAPDALDGSISALEPLAVDGMVIVDGRRVEVSEDSRPLVRIVASMFDAYLIQETAKHSSAI